MGEQFARSLSTKDRDGLIGLLADDIDFRGMTPGRVWEAATPAELIDDVIFGHWFEPSDHIESLDAIETGEVADRERVGYRFHIRNPDGLHLVEQQAYLSVADGRIDWLRIMCSGFRRIDS